MRNVTVKGRSIQVISPYVRGVVIFIVCVKGGGPPTFIDVQINDKHSTFPTPLHSPNLLHVLIDVYIKVKSRCF